MKIQPFELERWQSIWENKVELNISESGVEPLTVHELVDLSLIHISFRSSPRSPLDLC